MTAYYTSFCTICEHPIKKGAETKGVHSEWSHADKTICRVNIRADEAARHHDGGDCECASAYLGAEPGCGCWTCNVEERWKRMFICPECGNKRCPRATDHRNSCTSSNEPGQPGSRYGGLPT